MYPIEVKNLSYIYPDSRKKVFDKVSFKIEERDFLGIVGGNGTGKSTLLKLILGLLKPTSGTINFGKSSLNDVRSKIGYLSQFEDIDFSFPITNYEVVLAGNLRGKIFHKYSREEHQKVEEVMKELDIWNLKDDSLGDLSGGQKQKVFLARALVTSPEMLVLDEPLTSLDSHSQEAFYEKLKELNKKMTIIVVDHNLEMLVKYVNKVVCVDKCEKTTTKLHEGNLNSLVHI